VKTVLNLHDVFLIGWAIVGFSRTLLGIVRHAVSLYVAMCTDRFYLDVTCTVCQSQWHELSSLARTLGSWVRIPLKTWMSVMFALILCLCCSVCR
jgi:hypothetical protein